MRSIPIIGLGSAGKTTFLQKWATAMELRIVRHDCPVSISGQRTSAICLTTSFSHAGCPTELWCMPGGAVVEWQLGLARNVGRGILVVDPQRSRLDRTSALFEMIDQVSTKWAIAISKADLAGLNVGPQELIPRPLRASRLLTYSALDTQAPELIRDFMMDSVLPGPFVEGPGIAETIAAFNSGRLPVTNY